MMRAALLIVGAFAPAASGFAADELVIESALLRLIQQVEVPARAPGIISSVGALEGNSVEEGDLLAVVDDIEAKLLEGRAAIELQLSKEKVDSDVALRLAQKALAFNQSEFERMAQAADDTPGSISISQLELLRFQAAQAALELEKAKHERRVDQFNVDLKTKELALSRYNVDVRKIVAPINGVVVEVLRQPGEWVEPGDKVLRVVRMDRLRVEGMLHVRDITRELRGAPVTISLDVSGKNEATYPGKVVFVSPEISPVNGQVRIWAEVDNSDGLLRPGLRPRMTIHATPSDQQLGAAERISN